MFRKITLLGVMLAFIVVVMGASLRLSGTEVLSIENGLLKDFLTDRHFYTSAGLTVVVFLIGILAWYEQECRKTALITAFSLLGLVVAQGYLGLWSVSEHSPSLITGHSLLSMVILWWLFWLYLRSDSRLIKPISNGSVLAGFAKLLLFMQIALGTWLSINHAGLACSDLSLCIEQLATADYLNAFNPDGVSTLPAQIALVSLHLLLAVVSFLVLLVVIIQAKSSQQSNFRLSALLLGVLLLIELGLGIASFRKVVQAPNYSTTVQKRDI